MKLAVLSDVHANAEALQRVLDDARACGAEQIVCLGDAVGYGPSPVETIRLLRSAASVTLLGNHDAAVCGLLPTEDFIELARESVLRHRAALPEGDRVWLRERPYAVSLGFAAFSHGDFTDPHAFNYLESPEDARANFAASDKILLFVGHTHTPALFIQDVRGEIRAHAPRDLTLLEGARYLVNVGSVGYPRQSDGQCFSSYVLYDTAARTLRFRFLPFAVSSVLQRGLPRARTPRLVGLGLVLFAALAASVCLVRRPPAEPALAQPSAAESAAPAHDPLLLDARQVTVFPQAEVHAHLEVKGAPVELTLTFRNAGDNLLIRQERLIVKHVSHKGFAVPPNATSARFEVRRLRESDAPRILRFAPTACRLKN